MTTPIDKIIAQNDLLWSQLNEVQRDCVRAMLDCAYIDGQCDGLETAKRAIANV